MGCTLSDPGIEKMAGSCIQLDQEGEEKGFVEGAVKIRKGLFTKEWGWCGYSRKLRKVHEQ